MNLRLAVGAVLRTLRSKEKRTRESLADASSHTYLAKLEHGKSGITVEKLELISTTFGISPLTFLALALATSRGETTANLLSQARIELEEFEASYGLVEIANQLKDGELITRPPGKQMDSQRLENVLRCKAGGMSQKMTAEKLGISKQTVNKLWWRDQE
jgi:transcriptional regulator with XRE-family HTH domain